MVRRQPTLDEDIYRALEALRLDYAKSLLHYNATARRPGLSDILRPLLQAHGLLPAPLTEREKWAYVTINRIVSIHRLVQETPLPLEESAPSAPDAAQAEAA